MKPIDRRTFLLGSFGGLMAALSRPKKTIMTVKGPIFPDQLGTTLIHEHFLVDFIGADRINPNRWNRDAVVRKVLPYLTEAKKAGVKSVFDCTPALLGRDAEVLQELSAQSGLHLVTNTGYYGALDNKYLPPWAFTETAEQLAQRWTSEAKHGIEGTGVRPGFIKISVDAKESLSELHQKLVRAAALTHLQTGLTICSHTGLATGAFQQLALLQKAGVHPSAFVWVHAQTEKDMSTYARAASMGSWVSLDGVGWGEQTAYTDALVFLKSKKLLHRVLISHDAGWYKPDEPDAAFQGYTAIFRELLPHLKTKGFTQKDQEQLLVKNPAAAMQMQVRAA
jgi:phosphotriesterase-related protein